MSPPLSQKVFAGAACLSLASLVVCISAGAARDAEKPGASAAQSGQVTTTRSVRYPGPPNTRRNRTDCEPLREANFSKSVDKGKHIGSQGLLKNNASRGDNHEKKKWKLRPQSDITIIQIKDDGDDRPRRWKNRKRKRKPRRQRRWRLSRRHYDKPYSNNNRSRKLPSRSRISYYRSRRHRLSSSIHRRRKSWRHVQPQYNNRRYYIWELPPFVVELKRRVQRKIAELGHDVEYRLKSSIHRVLQTAQYVVQQYARVKGEARNMMNKIREILPEVIAANDAVYAVLLSANYFTRRIYQRVHKHIQMGTNPTTPPTHLTTMNLDFSSVHHKARRSERQGRQLMDICYKRKRATENLERKFKETEWKLQRSLTTKRLLDLRQLTNITLIKIMEMPVLQPEHWNHKIETERQDIKRNLHYTKFQMVDANHVLADTTRTYMYAKQRIAILKKKYQYIESLPTVESEPLKPRVRRRLRKLINRVKRHTEQLDKVAGSILTNFQPLFDIVEEYVRNNPRKLQKSRRRRRRRRRLERSPSPDWREELRQELQEIIRKIDRMWKKILAFIHKHRPVKCKEDVEGSGLDLEECDDDDNGEGSGHLPIVDGFRPPETDDFDFIDPVPVPVTMHGELLLAFVSNQKTRSEDVLKDSQMLSEKLSDLKGQLRKFDKSIEKTKLDLTDIAKFVTEDILALKNDHARIQQRLDNVTQLIALSETQNKKVIEIASRVLAAAEYRFKTPVRRDEGKIGSVSDAKRNLKKISGLLKKLPADPCRAAETRINYLRSNISQIQQKIEAARTILSALQISLGLDGSDFLTVPLRHPQKSREVRTVVSLCVKPAKLSSPLLWLEANNSVKYSLELDNGKPLLMVFDRTGSKMSKLEGGGTLTANNWYTIRLERFGQNFSLNVSPLSLTENSIRKTSTEIASFPWDQRSPTIVFVGGYPRDFVKNRFDKNLDGCVGSLEVNGRSVSILSKIRKEGKSVICPNACFGKNSNTSMVFEGNGYVDFNTDVFPERGITEVQLSFRTRQQYALLLLIKKNSRFMLTVTLNSGNIHVEAKIKSSSMAVESSSENFSNGTFHHLQIKVKNKQLKVEVLGKKSKFKKRPAPNGARRAKQGIFLGGMTTNHVVGKDVRYRPLTGCLSDVQVNTQPIPLTALKTSRHVFQGSCQDSIWISCVLFDEKSQPITLEKFEVAKTLAFAVTSDSLGAVIHYKKNKKFSIDIRLAKKGVEVFNHNNDEEREISYNEENKVDNWHIFTVWDMNSSVNVSVDDRSVAVPYESDSEESSWWNKKPEDDPDTSVTLTVGGLPAELQTGSSSEVFTGGISTFLVENRAVDLSQYTLPSALSACAKPYRDDSASPKCSLKP